MKIVAISAFNDNYIWLIQDAERAIVVDPGDADPVLQYLAQEQLDLHAILVTHHHRDHIGGVSALLRRFPSCVVYGPEDIQCVNHAVAEGEQLFLLQHRFDVWFVPGHTHNHLAYVMHDGAGRLHVFCGDTLFSAGCGRVFCGTIDELYHSLMRFQAMPANTLFYPAHEYTASNIRFALSVEPNNPDLHTALAASVRTPTVPVTLEHELRINPFLRLDSAEIEQHLQAQNRPSTMPADRFASLRQLKNEF